MLSSQILEENNSKLKKPSGSSGGGKDKSPKKAPENGKDNSLSPSGQAQLRERQLALVRDMEMNWYLKLWDLSSQSTTACTTTMPHRANTSWLKFDLVNFTGTRKVIGLCQASFFSGFSRHIQPAALPGTQEPARMQKP
ncbi:hypothetical protein HJG60_007062 [Phyllostomus discolor]|uniref:Uncharacterized protein n=1 Tax=Phyllostomus discolor TaxID=89673 RepID=A0A834B1A1_9CHIR|nr:hypothetical protein HJG60_007062 [Phyllostomus discolor]